jgi:hypothetical protein
MTAVVDDEDLHAIRHAVTGQQKILLVNVGPSATVTKAIVEVLANSSYICVETEGVPKSNIFETQYSRQREWWNTPKKERRRKRK